MQTQSLLKLNLTLPPGPRCIPSHAAAGILCPRTLRLAPGGNLKVKPAPARTAGQGLATPGHGQSPEAEHATLDHSIIILLLSSVFEWSIGRVRVGDRAANLNIFEADANMPRGPVAHRKRLSTVQAVTKPMQSMLST